MLAILNSRGMGATFVSVAEYDKLSDWDLLHVYLAPRDEDTSDHITLRRRMLYAAGYAVSDGPEPEMPADPAVELGIPKEVLLSGVPVCWSAMLWRLGKKHGKTDEEILEAFRKKIKEVPPAGTFA